MTDVFDVAALVKQRPASVADKLDKIEPETAPKPAGGAPSRKGVTTEQAKRTERRPTKGEGSRAFGAPTDPPPLNDAQSREQIRRATADEVRRLNQRTNQSTDSQN